MTQVRTYSPTRSRTDRTRARHLTLATAARRRLDENSRTSGRAWINGREVGGADTRFAHLGRSYD
jgi:hypothetical protein